MPVRKFRSAEEMQATPVAAGRTGDFDRFLRHCARYRSMTRRTYPSGVFKFRNAEEADAARVSGGPPRRASIEFDRKA